MAHEYRCEFTTRADGRKLRRAAERKRRSKAKKNKRCNKEIMEKTD
jgi:hypothetical protein